MNEKCANVAVPHPLIASIYRAVQERGSWAESIEMLRVVMNSVAATFRISLRGNRPSEQFTATGPVVSAHAVAECEARTLSELLPFKLTVGEPRVVDRDYFKNQGSHLDLMGQFGVEEQIALLIDAHDDAQFVLQICRPKDAPRYTPKETLLFKAIGEHFRCAVHLLHSL